MIRVGIGGWTYEPWRGVFYPDDLPQKQELNYASRHVTAIEVNGTFYGTFKPKTFAAWHDEAPDDFVFSLKAPRFAVNRKVLGEAGPSITKFMESGISELKGKLGPILWQLAGTKKYDPADIAAFLDILPREIDGIRLRHVLEARHTSFLVPQFVEQVRKAGVATVLADSADYPLLADLSTDFLYLRLQDAKPDIKTGYSAKDLDKWTALARAWAKGEEPDQLPLVAPKMKPLKARDVFVFFINGAKENAPAAAQAMIKRLKE